MSGTELDIKVDGALTEELISGERAALFASGKREANLVEHYIMYPSTKDSKERQNIMDSAKVLSLAKKPYSRSLRNVEYSILLVMSELSTVRCDRALGLWIAGTRASSVDGELPWRCCGRWTVRWTAVKGSRDRSSDRAAAVASTPGSRAQAATEGGFLGLRHKTKEADGG